MSFSVVIVRTFFVEDRLRGTGIVCSAFEGGEAVRTAVILEGSIEGSRTMVKVWVFAGVSGKTASGTIDLTRVVVVSLGVRCVFCGMGVACFFMLDTNKNNSVKNTRDKNIPPTNSNFFMIWLFLIVP